MNHQRLEMERKLKDMEKAGKERASRNREAWRRIDDSRLKKARGTLVLAFARVSMVEHKGKNYALKFIAEAKRCLESE